MKGITVLYAKDSTLPAWIHLTLLINYIQLITSFVEKVCTVYYLPFSEYMFTLINHFLPLRAYGLLVDLRIPVGSCIMIVLSQIIANCQ